MSTKLERFYEQTFGTPQSRGELYAGFFLLIAGFVLTIAGILIFLGISHQFPGITEYRWREAGGVIAALGPPCILFGIAVSLPSKWTMRLLDGVGIGLCAAAIGLFVIFYPFRWNTGTGHEMWAALVYVAGAASLLASTLTSLIGYYVVRSQTPGAESTYDVHAPQYNYDIPDSVIQKDIELVVRRYNAQSGEENP